MGKNMLTVNHKLYKLNYIFETPPLENGQWHGMVNTTEHDS